VCAPVISFVFSDEGEHAAAVVDIVHCTVLQTALLAAQLNQRSDKFQRAVFNTLLILNSRKMAIVKMKRRSSIGLRVVLPEMQTQSIESRSQA
jgi:hypothetical protein